MFISLLKKSGLKKSIPGIPAFIQGLIVFWAVLGFVAGCAEKQPYQPYAPTQGDLNKRHDMMLDAVLERPKRLQYQLRVAAFEQYERSMRGWWAVEGKKQAKLAKIAKQRRADYNHFMGLMKEQERLRQLRLEEQRERWRQYMKLKIHKK